VALKEIHNGEMGRGLPRPAARQEITMTFRLTLSLMLMIFASASVCQAMELKDITFKTKDAGKVVFSHKSHLEKKTRTTANLSCKTCHESGKLGTTRHYTMAEMEKGKSCGACHNGKKAFPLAKCTRCHRVKEITYKVKETGPVLFSHNSHLKTMQCGSCHNGIFKAGPNARTTMAEMEKGKSCGACHKGKTAFKISECVKCHPVKEENFKVEDVGDVPFSHKFHIGMYSCSECHTRLYLPGKGNPKVSMSDMEKGKSCGACHDGSSAFTVKENCDKCHRSK
jgi:c(7)-type cytochrome triheme protein